MNSIDDTKKDLKPKLTKSGILTILGPFRWLTVQSIVFFIAAGKINLTRAWIYIGLIFIFSIVGAIFYWKVIPELANKRGKKSPGMKKWDIILVMSYFLCVLIPMPLIIGLDVGRYSWSSLNIYFAVIGIILYILSFILVEWCLFSNKHFEGIVRIQKDRDHQVISSGPYKFVRHPGYVGMIIGGLAMPFIIGSVYGLIFNILPTILIIIRTYYEDLTLKNELDGYLEYTTKIKYRLIPFIW